MTGYNYRPGPTTCIYSAGYSATEQAATQLTHPEHSTEEADFYL